ncbi:MAG: ABC transporter ATP-binding protein [Acidimicrobiia bacterium]
MLAVSGAVKRFDGTAALDGTWLDVADGEVVAVLGPSGCGKSTLLRVIAGLETLDAGTVHWDGVDLTGVPVHQRRFGLMFQGYALFPHKTVSGNVGFGLRMLGLEKAEVDRTVAEALAWVGLEDVAGRRVDALSGGEQQRVALARTLAPAPRLVMLDEPIGALDRTLRERLIEEIGDLLRQRGSTAIYVTHDHAEAETVADRVAVMRAGRIVQAGLLEEIRARPADEWVAGFVGHAAAGRQINPRPLP